jgi:hypothetical protein
MAWLLRRATRIGLFSFGVVGVFVFFELAFGGRSWADIAVVALLATVTFAALRGVRGSQHASDGSHEELRLPFGGRLSPARPARPH